MSLDRVVHELVSSIRRAGVQLSPVEAIDAQRAAMAVGLGSREDLRAALRAALVKHPDHRDRFDRAFDAFFAADGRAQGHLYDRLRSMGFSDLEVGTLDEALGALGALGEGAASGLGMTALAAIVAGGGALDHLLFAAGRAARLDRMQGAMQIGFYTMRLLDAAGLPRAQTELGALRSRLRDALGARGDALADALTAELEKFRHLARGHVADALRRQHPTQGEDARAERLAHRPFAALDRAEAERVRDEVRRLGERLRGKLAVRRKHERRGALDVRRTLRAAYATGGVPFRPALRRRRRDRPKLVVLCDVSDSVRAAARFLLVFVHTVQEVFASTRSFVFVSDVAEATALFRAEPVERAIAMAYGGSVVSVAANSHYGAVFEAMAERHFDALDARTTLLVIGDGRNNFNDPGLPAFERLCRRAGRVVWLNPEPPGAWGFGDSAMKLYQPLCRECHTVHDLASLRRAVDRLVTGA